MTEHVKGLWMGRKSALKRQPRDCGTRVEKFKGEHKEIKGWFSTRGERRFGISPGQRKGGESIAGGIGGNWKKKVGPRRGGRA